MDDKSIIASPLSLSLLFQFFPFFFNLLTLRLCFLIRYYHCLQSTVTQRKISQEAVDGRWIRKSEHRTASFHSFQSDGYNCTICTTYLCVDPSTSVIVDRTDKINVLGSDLLDCPFYPYFTFFLLPVTCNFGR